MLRRREFIGLVGAGVACSPHAVRAQQTMRRVTVLLPSRESDTLYQARVAALKEALQQRGWVDGSNVRIDIRWAGDSSERISEIAGELSLLAPDVIVASGSPATAAMKRATASVPV